MTNVWIFTTGTGPAYDATQTNSDIKDGDVLIVPNEGVVAIMYLAWPTALTAEHGHFHTFVAGPRDADMNDKHLDGIETAQGYMSDIGHEYGPTIPSDVKVLNHDKLSEPGNYRILSPIGVSDRF